MDSSFNKFVAGICYLAAAGLFALGIYTMLTYGDADAGDYTGHVVGGDAYNFIIIATRGTGYIVAGVLFAVCGAAGSITAAIKEHANHLAAKHARDGGATKGAEQVAAAEIQNP